MKVIEMTVDDGYGYGNNPAIHALAHITSYHLSLVGE